MKTTLVVDLLFPNSFFNKYYFLQYYLVQVFFKSSNSINLNDSRFSNVMIIVMRTTEVLIFIVVFEKDPYLNIVEKIKSSCGIYSKNQIAMF